VTTPNVQESGRKGEAAAKRRRARRRAGRVSDYALSTAMVLAITGFWFAWLTPPKVNAKVDANPGIRLRHLSLAEQIAWGKAGRWPSILMSVPTREGFSGEVLADKINPLPRLDDPEIELLYLKRNTAGDGQTVSPSTPALPRDVLLSDARRSRHSPTLPPRPTLPSVVRPVFEIVFSGGLEKSDFLRTPLAEPLIRGVTGWWVARFWVELDAEGDVRVALLEEGTGQPDLDRALVRGIHQWQGKDTGRTSSGEVRIGSVGRSPVPGDEE